MDGWMDQSALNYNIITAGTRLDETAIYIYTYILNGKAKLDQPSPFNPKLWLAVVYTIYN